MSERMPEHAVRGVVEESEEIPLWDRLGELACPVLVVRGGRRGGLVTEQVAAQWQAALPTVELALLPEAGHDLWSYDRDAYLAILLPFLERVDRTAAQP
jgi:pimeloyl-ACP methyl ester carboxylesterase